MHSCEQTSWLSDEAFLRDFSKKVFEQKVPLSGSIDLTDSCNLRCSHCYISDGRERKTIEMNTSTICKIIDEITESGCLHLLLTGGEPLLRKDFREIYVHAKMRGLLVSVFSNGTLVDIAIADLLKSYPPASVEISLYGSSQKVYESITGIAGSFRRCIQGIELLVSSSINVKLKTVLMSLNADDLFEIRRTAGRFGAPFRLDPAIFPRLNGDQGPMDLRISPRTAVEMEFSDPARIDQWRKHYNKFKGLRPSKNLYSCGAGSTNFHIDASGNLKPCLMTRHISYDLNRGSFSAGWQSISSQIKGKLADPGSDCTSCNKRSLCGICPGFAELETGSESERSKYLCDLGSHRFQLINNEL
ncbi:MAG: radical SAM protein [Nitrospirota bacterium]|nr:MAG: radical SAM protein [Nitrospirota bacterium]